MKTFLYDFVTFFVVIDPVGTAVVFASMTTQANETQRRQMARHATGIAGLILLAFAFLGGTLLAALGISLPAFRVAGGLMLFLLAVDMVFARPSAQKNLTAAEDQEAMQRGDITVFPIAFPLIAGPGAMTSVILLVGRAEGQPWSIFGMIAVLALVLLVTLGLLLVAGRLLRLLGLTGSNVVGRVLGIILAALAVQLVIDGLLQSFHL
ncbi:MAG TPA: MarC family protein [Telmatospirillum sp.]|nr:MarC family protein [Telmatospirillum sp.]